MEYRLSCESIYEDEEYYWFSEVKFNGFYRVHKETMKSELVFRFPDENLQQERLHQQIKKIGDWFVFVPCWSQYITIYNQVTKEIKNFSLSRIDEMGRKYIFQHPSFSSVCWDGNEVYYIPHDYPAIVKLNLETQKLEYLTEWLDYLVKKHPKPDLDLPYFRDCFIKGDKMYLTSYEVNKIIIFHINTKEISYDIVSTESEGFSELIFNGQSYWAISVGENNPNIIFYRNFNTNEVKKIELNVDNTNDALLFTYPVEKKDIIYLFSWKKQSLVAFNTKTNILSNLSFLDEIFHQNLCLPIIGFKNVMCLTIQDDCLKFISAQDSAWYFVNLETQEIKKTYVAADDEGKMILSEKSFSFFEQTYGASLSEFCSYIYSGEGSICVENKGKYTVGKDILEATV